MDDAFGHHVGRRTFARPGPVGIRGEQPPVDLLDPVRAADVVVHHASRVTPTSDSASATTTPVRSLPAAQWTSEVPLPGSASTRKALTDVGPASRT
jgi:hypothetical protein